ncbi:hypothetical protein KVM76_01500 [Helicobacter pylori]|nr:hypothetical protein KVM76_01500 [Helicobacter pylori]
MLVYTKIISVIDKTTFFIILAKHYSSPSADELLEQGDLHEDGFRLKLRSP